MFKTISEVKQANTNLGHHFFDRDTMRFFDSKIEFSDMLATDLHLRFPVRSLSKTRHRPATAYGNASQAV